MRTRGYQRQAVEHVGRYAVVGDARPLHPDGPHVAGNLPLMSLASGNPGVALVVVALDQGKRAPQFLVVVVEVLVFHQVEHELMHLAQVVLAALGRCGGLVPHHLVDEAPPLGVHHLEQHAPGNALHKAVGGVITHVEPQRPFGFEHAPCLRHGLQQFGDKFLLCSRCNALGPLAAAAPIGWGGDDAVDALVFDGCHHGRSVTSHIVRHQRPAQFGHHVPRDSGFIVMLGCGVLCLAGGRINGFFSAEHLLQQSGGSCRHLVVGDMAVGLVGQPHGDQFVGVGLEDAGQPEHLVALGAPFTVFIAAVGRHVHADSLGQVFLALAALEAQLSDFIRE